MLRAGPSRAGPSQAGPSQAGPSRAGPPQAAPEAAGPERDRLGRLMAAAQAGDARAYLVLLRAAETWARAYFAHRLPPAFVADAVQDTLLAVHEKRHTYDPARPFGPWLAAIARYKWIDRLRHMRATATEALDDAIATASHEDAVGQAWALEGLLGSLKPAQAEVIRLVRLEGLSIAEASSRTGQSPSLVKVNIHRGLARLVAAARRRDHAP